MSINSRIAEEQPDRFAFTAQNKQAIKTILAKYPTERKASAVIPLLDLAQRQHDNWIPMKAIEVIADTLEMAEMRVLEVATFYTMFNLRPVGKHYIQACGTTPCWLRGGNDVMRCVYDKLGIRNGETTPDGKFSLLEVECLGACVNAPIVQINDDYYEDLDYLTMAELLDKLSNDDVPPAGSVKGRIGSQPESGPTSLKTVVAFPKTRSRKNPLTAARKTTKRKRGT
jgi:NADH-quinone oxidoreductase E subunit